MGTRFLSLSALVCCLSMAVAAQPTTFGSMTDPTEGALDPLRRAAARLATMGGPSYVGVQWRVVGGFEAEGSIGPFAVSIEQYLRVGHDGLYEPDVSEPYDLVRALRYARIDPTPAVPVYLRFGPIRRMTLDAGLLVRGYSTIAAWDERTVGVEAAASVAGIDLGAFTSDVRLGRVVGGYVAAAPGAGLADGLLSRVRLSAEVVHDLGLTGEDATTAVGATGRLTLLTLGDAAAGVVVSHARYRNYGHGTLAGVEAGMDLFDIGAAHVRAGVVISSDAFIPGFVNAFYPVHSPRARITPSDAYFRDATTQARVGTTLGEAPGGVGLDFELSAAVFNVLEFGQYVRREYGRATGAYGLRLALTPDRGRSIRFLFDVQRQGLRGFRDLFSDLVDEAILTFRVDYAAADPVHVFVRSRYGYRSAGIFDDGAERYLIERRFEPMVGVVIWR